MPQPGDWVLFDHHVEVVTSYSGGVLHTIGANAAPDYTVDAHSFSGSLAADGVAGFVDNGHLAKATGSGAGAAAGASHAAGTGASTGAGHATDEKGGKDSGTQQDRAAATASPGASGSTATGAKAADQADIPGLPPGQPTAPPRAAGKQPAKRQAQPTAKADIPGLVTPGGPASGNPATRGGTGRSSAKRPDTAKSSAAIPGATPAPSTTPQPAATPTPSATPKPAATPQPAATGRSSGTGPSTAKPSAAKPSAAKPSAAVPSHSSVKKPYQRHSDPPTASTPGTSYQQTFISTVAPGAMAAQQRWGVPAAVTIAQAIEESAWGQSSLSATYHNLFGIKGTGPAGLRAAAHPRVRERRVGHDRRAVPGVLQRRRVDLGSRGAAGDEWVLHAGDGRP